MFPPVWLARRPRRAPARVRGRLPLALLARLRLPNSNAIRCPGGGVEWNDNRATYEYLSPYGMPGGVIRSNLRFVGRIHAGACDDGPETRVEVYAFGCPVM